MSRIRKSPRAAVRQPAKSQPSVSAAGIGPGSPGGASPDLPDLTQSPDAPVDPLAVRTALGAGGLLGAWPDDDDLPTDPAESAALERADEAWLLATFTEPLGLSDAVIEDRG